MPNDLAEVELADAEPADDGLGAFAELMQYEERQRSRPLTQRPNSTKAIPDGCNPCGAAELMRRIKAFWRAAGYDISITMFKTAHGDNDIRSVMSIRSNMVGGLPPRQ